MGRKRKKKVRFEKTKTMIAILIPLLIVSFVVVTQTDIFIVKDISINGDSEISRDKILLASGIEVGDNIFNLKTKNAKENLLLNPYVRDAHIKRVYPDQVNIEIEERKELALIEHMETYVYIGFNGLVLDVVDDEKEKKVPLLKGIEIENPSIGSRVTYKKKDKERNQIKNIIENLSKKGITNQTKDIVFKDGNVNLNLESGTKIEFGRPSNIEYKMTFLENALKDLKTKDITAKNIYLNKGNDIIVEVVGSKDEKDEN